MSETNQKNSKQASDLTDIGAFWKKTKNGKTFLSGKVKISNREFTAFIFTNNKSKPNQPDYRLTISDLDEDFKSESAGASRPKQKPETVVEDTGQDDIPF